MLDELSFGEFITVYRKKKRLTLRTFADMLSLSPAYISQIESGKRPAPSLAIQQKMIMHLELNDNEAAQMYSLAAKTKVRNPVPADIAAFIAKDEQVQAFLRWAIKCQYTGIDLLRLIEYGNDL